MNEKHKEKKEIVLRMVEEDDIFACASIVEFLQLMMLELKEENEKLKWKIGKQKKELERWQNEFGDQDDFTNRTCGYCDVGFELDDPHYYDEEEGECYCNEECFKKSVGEEEK